MGNIHFTEIFDFFVGWLGFDFSKDDWATRLADERQAPSSAQDGKPKEAAKEPAEEPAKEPPRKPRESPPPKKGKYPLEDLIP